MSDQRVQWGVLGATAYISGHMLSAIDASPTGVVTAVGSRPSSLSEAAGIAARYGARAVEGYDAVLASGDVDAVYIALPNTMHVEWACRALQAGKHVLVEKPLAMTPEDVLTVRDAARTARRRAMEAFMYRFHPQHAIARDALANGAIGELRAVRASFAFGIHDPGNIRLDPALGGGATWDVGCYPVDVARWYLGTPLAARAFSSPRPNGLDGTVAAVLDFGGGRFATIDYSIDYGPQSSYELQGTTGWIKVHNAWAMKGMQARITIAKGDGPPHEVIVQPVDHYELQVRAFEAAVLYGHSAPYSLAESVENAAATRGVLQAAMTLKDVIL